MRDQPEACEAFLSPLRLHAFTPPRLLESIAQPPSILVLVRDKSLQYYPRNSRLQSGFERWLFPLSCAVDSAYHLFNITFIIFEPTTNWLAGSAELLLMENVFVKNQLRWSERNVKQGFIQPVEKPRETRMLNLL